MMLDNDDQLDALVQEELKEIGTSEIRQRFKVCNTIRKVVERIKKDVPLVCPYLSEVDSEKAWAQSMFVMSIHVMILML